MAKCGSDPSKRLAVVTGAAGGIGAALVTAFTEHGHRVIALGNAPLPASLVCWRYLQTDLQRLVPDPAFAAETLSAIKDLVGDGGPSVLVNNAAIQVLGGVDSLSMADWRSTLDVNLVAPFVLTQGLLPQLEAADECVINISSIHARLTKANLVAYATSKAALSGMTRAMAVDLGGRVRVNAIEPAGIATDMLKAGFAGEPERLPNWKAATRKAASAPRKRLQHLMWPSQVARCAFCTGNASAWMGESAGGCAIRGDLNVAFHLKRMTVTAILIDMNGFGVQ